jgi:hypothetical protein
MKFMQKGSEAQQLKAKREAEELLEELLDLPESDEEKVEKQEDTGVEDAKDSFPSEAGDREQREQLQRNMRQMFSEGSFHMPTVNNGFHVRVGGSIAVNTTRDNKHLLAKLIPDIDFKGAPSNPWLQPEHQSKEVDQIKRTGVRVRSRASGPVIDVGEAVREISATISRTVKVDDGEVQPSASTAVTLLQQSTTSARIESTRKQKRKQTPLRAPSTSDGAQNVALCLEVCTTDVSDTPPASNANRVEEASGETETLHSIKSHKSTNRKRLLEEVSQVTQLVQAIYQQGMSCSLMACTA